MPACVTSSRLLRPSWPWDWPARRPPARSAADPPAATIALTIVHPAINSGDAAVLTGTAPGAAPGTGVTLYALPDPYRTAPDLVSTTAIDTAGHFSFTVTPDRDTRYTARLGSTGAQASVAIGVIGKTVTKLRALPLGRALVTLVVFHPRDLQWGHTVVHWSFAGGRNGRFRTATPTHAIALSPSATVLRTTASLPAGRYRFRACFTPPDGDRPAQPAASSWL